MDRIRIGVVGLRFEDEARQRQHQVALGAAVGRSLGAPTVTLVGFQRYEGQRALVGTVVGTATARTLRSALVLVEPTPPSPEILRRLARFLLGGPGGPGIIVRGSAAAARKEERSDGPFAAPIWKWAAAGTAAVALGGGIVALALDGKCVDDPPRPGGACRDLYQTTALGVGLSIGGAALAGAAIYLFIRSRGAESTATVAAPWVERRGGGISAHWRF